MNKFIDHFRNPSGKLTTKQSIALADEFGRIAKDLVDPNGQKIFRYNNRTQNIELADGRGLENLEGNSIIDKIKKAVEGSQSEFEKLQSTTPIHVKDEISKNAGKSDLKRAAINAFVKEYPQGVKINTKIGEVNISRSNVKESLGHTLYPAKADAVLSLPMGMNNAAYIGKLKDFSGKPIENHYFVYPIKYGDRNRLVFCRVREIAGRGNSFYVHDVFVTNEINAKSDALSQTQTPAEKQGELRGVALYERILTEFFSEGKQGEQDSKIKYSIGNSENEHSWLKGLAKKLGKALHLNGDKIITEEDRRKAHLQEQEKAMADYLKDPSKDNKYRLNKLGVTKGQLQAYMNGEEYLTGIGLRQNTIASPSRIADKVAVFRAFFRMGDRAMDKLVKLRDSFSRKYDSAMDLVKSKEECEKLFEILWDGDEEQKVFTKEELLQDGVSENVADAYIAIRRQMNRAYTLLDEAKRRPQSYAKYLSYKQYEKLRDNKFVKQDTLKIHDKQDEDGRHLVTWTDFFANYEREYTLNKNALDKFKADDAIQILDEKQLEDGTYKITVREGIPALINRKGYIPHFFPRIPRYS